VQTSWSERNRGVGRVCAVGSAKTRRFPSSRRGLCLAPPIGCGLSTNRKRKPKWRRCVAASIAVGPSAILTGHGHGQAIGAGIDDSAPWKTEETVTRLATVPAQATKALVRNLRASAVNIASKRRMQIEKVMYLGDVHRGSDFVFGFEDST